MGYLMSSKKGKSIGLPWVWGGIVGVLIAWHFGVPETLIAAVYLGGSLVVLGHMIAYGLADAAHGDKK